MGQCGRAVVLNQQHFLPCFLFLSATDGGQGHIEFARSVDAGWQLQTDLLRLKGTGGRDENRPTYKK